mmetsp:Transcript_50601/g.149226  ORF Transcript_50601/g.149226 Transcript_50601/m.149226 type:complete len:106 (+) Transcript_50601:359-676(+)
MPDLLARPELGPKDGDVDVGEDKRLNDDDGVRTLEPAPELAPERDCLRCLAAPPTALIAPRSLRDADRAVLVARLPAEMSRDGSVAGRSAEMSLKFVDSCVVKVK